MPAAKAAPAKAAATKRKRESSSSSSSSDSDDDKPTPKAAAKDEDTSALKKQKTQDGAVVTANGGASNTIFVGGLSFQAEESDVKDFFTEFGEIRTVRIPVHSDTGRKKGLAFVEFVNPQDAAAAVSKDQAEMMGRYLNVSLSTSTGRGSTAPRSQELSERPAGCKTVFVGNVRSHTDRTVSICIHSCASCSLLPFVCLVSFPLSCLGRRLRTICARHSPTAARSTTCALRGTRSRTAARDSVTSSSVSCSDTLAHPARLKQENLWRFGSLAWLFVCIFFCALTETEEAVDAAIKVAGTEVAGRQIRVDYAPVRERKSFGGDGGGRGGRGGGRGGAGGRGGFGGGRGGRGGSTPSRPPARGGMGGFSGKKVSFD
jgi:uncharacterized membrane protein YgcG